MSLERNRFLADASYGVACVCVVGAIVEGTAISLLHPAFGSFFDSRLGFFTLIDISSFALFAFAFSFRSSTNVWCWLTAYGSIVLSAPGAFYMFDMFMWMEFGAGDGIAFPILSSVLLGANVILYRST